MIKMNEVNVLVTGVNGGSIGEQVIKALRMSNNIKYNITATNDTFFSKSLYDADNFDILPKINDAELIVDDYIEKLLYIIENYCINVIIPCTEPEIKFFLNIKDILEKNGVLVLLNDNLDIYNICFNKFLTQKFISFDCYHEFLGKLNFNYISKFNIEEKINDYAYTKFPCIVKPFSGSGSNDVFICQSYNELKSIAEYFFYNNDETLLIQDYVGNYDDKNEFTVGVLTDENSNIINSIVFKRIDEGLSKKKKNKTNDRYKDRFGDYLYISSGISQIQIKDDEISKIVAEVCEYISQMIESKGVINIQCRYFEDKVYIMEINPRLSGTTCMRAMLGYNEPDLLIRQKLFNEKINERFSYNTNKFIFRGLEEKMFG